MSITYWLATCLQLFFCTGNYFFVYFICKKTAWSGKIPKLKSKTQDLYSNVLYNFLFVRIDIIKLVLKKYRSEGNFWLIPSLILNVITVWSLEGHFCKPVAINTRVSIQANKLNLATNYVARLQHCTAICGIVSITVTTATIALWLKHRMKHISNRGPYLSSREADNSASLLSLQILQLPPPLKWHSNIYPCFLADYVQYFVFTLNFFVSLLMSSLWLWRWWGILWFCCCCLFFAIVYSLDMKVSGQVRVGTVPA